MKSRRDALLEKLEAARIPTWFEWNRRYPASLKLQIVTPRDQFENCTLSVEQWLANDDECGYSLKRKADKWQFLMQACALAVNGVRGEDGLRQEPRVGFDPVGDQPYVIFKASNNGTTFVVSLFGLPFGEDEICDEKSPR